MNDSVSDMVSVGGASMAGLSDQSGGAVQRVGSDYDDDVSNADVQVVRAGGDTTTDDINTSMAGLSDVSMGDIRKLGNDSMADYSMASLNDESMAGIDDSGYRGPPNKLA